MSARAREWDPEETELGTCGGCGRPTARGAGGAWWHIGRTGPCGRDGARFVPARGRQQQNSPRDRQTPHAPRTRQQTPGEDR